MNEYVVMSGTEIIAVIKARNFKKAAKKALVEMAREYKKKYNVKMLRMRRSSG